MLAIFFSCERGKNPGSYFIRPLHCISIVPVLLLCILKCIHPSPSPYLVLANHLSQTIISSPPIAATTTWALTLPEDRQDTDTAHTHTSRKHGGEIIRKRPRTRYARKKNLPNSTEGSTHTSDADLRNKTYVPSVSSGELFLAKNNNPTP